MFNDNIDKCEPRFDSLGLARPLAKSQLECQECAKPIHCGQNRQIEQELLLFCQ
jgi:hypothetical protein